MNRRHIREVHDAALVCGLFSLLLGCNKPPEGSTEFIPYTPGPAAYDANVFNWDLSKASPSLVFCEMRLDASPGPSEKKAEAEWAEKEVGGFVVRYRHPLDENEFEVLVTYLDFVTAEYPKIQGLVVWYATDYGFWRLQDIKGCVTTDFSSWPSGASIKIDVVGKENNRSRRILATLTAPFNKTHEIAMDLSAIKGAPKLRSSR